MNQTRLDLSRSFAEGLDHEDPLAHFRDQFFIPRNQNGEEYLYFCGNSLGLQPKNCAEKINQELTDWQNLGVEGHFRAKNPWYSYHETVTDSLAKIVGALPSEVVAMNSLTVNLHLLMASFYRPTAKRYKILVEANAFPSDQYAVKSQAAFHGFDPDKAVIEFKAKDGGVTIPIEEIIETINLHGDSIALVMIGGVNYLSGQKFPLKAICQASHAVGANFGVDLAHAAGNVLLNLHDDHVDFASWCSYKYLNAGPGGISGIFVHEDHQNSDSIPRFAGWWGHDKQERFAMKSTFKPIPGAQGWQLSNPPIFQLAALRASLDIFDAAGMKALHEKSQKMSRYLFELIRANLSNVEIVSPVDVSERGCQLSLRIKNIGKNFVSELESRRAILDFRSPDIIRVAPVPLYNKFTDIWDFVALMKSVTLP